MMAMSVPHHLGDPRGSRKAVGPALARDAESDWLSILVLADHLEDSGELAGADALRDGDLTPARYLLEPPTWRERRARIESLTSAEKVRMPAWVDHWIKVGLRAGDTTEHDHERFARAIAICYDAHQPNPLPAPRVVWVTSPLVACLVGPIVEMLRTGVHSGVGSGVGSGVRSGVVSGVVSGVDSGVHSGVRSGVVSGVVSGVDSGVYLGLDSGVVSGVVSGLDSGVHSGVHSGVGSGVRSGVVSAPKLTKQIRDNYHQYIGGASWVGYGYGWWGPASVAYMLDVCGITLGPRLDRIARAQQTVCETSYLYWPGRDVVTVAPRPLVLERDASGQLTRAAWSDGWEVIRASDGSYAGNCDVGSVLRDVLPPWEALLSAGKKSAAKPRKKAKVARGK